MLPAQNTYAALHLLAGRNGHCFFFASALLWFCCISVGLGITSLSSITDRHFGVVRMLGATEAFRVAFVAVPGSSAAPADVPWFLT